MRTKVLLATACSTLMFAAPLHAAPGAVGDRPVEPAGQPLPESVAANVRVAGSVVEPRKVAPDVASLRAPEGYRVSIFANELGNARILAVGGGGSVYVTRRAEGDVMMLKDSDGDGRADLREIVARRPGMHGIAIDGAQVFLVTVKDIYTAPILAGGRFGALTRIVDDLPDSGQHPNRTIAVGGDGMLYVSVGSTCNACKESSPESATILKISKDGKQRGIHATGLRNTIGFDWHPRTGQLWGLDHGIDWLGDEQQPEELNLIAQGKAYGWPYIYAMGGHNPQDDPPGELTMDTWDKMSRRPVLGTDAHAAPMQMAFYRGTMFPAADQGSAFAAFRGSWNRKDPVGYDIRRIRFDAAGNPQAIEPFVTGFLDNARAGPSYSARPVGLAEAKDGALLFTDDMNGVVYRVAYTGPAARGAMLAKPVMAPAPLEPRPFGKALAMARHETAARMPLSTMSETIRPRGTIPQKHSAWYEDVSPALSWSGVPTGARSYAILMEDPDAKVGLPFVHWVAWNIPAGTTKLPEGVSTSPQIKELGYLRQGRNTRGSTGYFGPRPPVGDPPHRYHFQIFALDTMLDILPGSDRETLLAAIKGHVLAKGELVGLYGQARPPVK